MRESQFTFQGKIGKKRKAYPGIRTFLGGQIRPTRSPIGLGGDNPYLEIGKDLVPSSSPRPTPVMLAKGSHNIIKIPWPEMQLFENTFDYMFDMPCCFGGHYDFPMIKKGGRPATQGRNSKIY